MHSGASEVAEQAVTFCNHKGEKLTGILTLPDSKKSVILCHGFSSHKNGFHFQQMANVLARQGWAALRFDFSGNGDSEGQFEFGNYKKEVEEIKCAQQHLQEMGKEVVALVGGCGMV